MKISIRNAREADAASIVALLNPIIQTGQCSVMDEPVSVQEQIEFLRGFPARGVFLVAVVENETVVGIQDVQPISTAHALRRAGEISTFVALDFQGRGVGKQLCQATFRAARARGFLKLRATVRADNPRALAFYAAQGFERIGIARKHALVRGTFIDEVLTEKFLDEDGGI